MSDSLVQEMLIEDIRRVSRLVHDLTTTVNEASVDRARLREQVRSLNDNLDRVMGHIESLAATLGNESHRLDDVRDDLEGLLDHRRAEVEKEEEVGGHQWDVKVALLAAIAGGVVALLAELLERFL